MLFIDDLQVTILVMGYFVLLSDSSLSHLFFLLQKSGVIRQLLISSKVSHWIETCHLFC